MCGCDEDPGILPRVLDSVFVSLGEQLYCGSDLKPKNFSEVERLSGAERRREIEATTRLLGKVCVVGAWCVCVTVDGELHMYIHVCTSIS